jgi:hypothetical protein
MDIKYIETDLTVGHEKPVKCFGSSLRSGSKRHHLIWRNRDSARSLESWLYKTIFSSRRRDYEEGEFVRLRGS